MDNMSEEPTLVQDGEVLGDLKDMGKGDSEDEQ